MEAVHIYSHRELCSALDDDKQVPRGGNDRRKRQSTQRRSLETLPGISTQDGLSVYHDTILNFFKYFKPSRYTSDTRANPSRECFCSWVTKRRHPLRPASASTPTRKVNASNYRSFRNGCATQGAEVYLPEEIVQLRKGKHISQISMDKRRGNNFKDMCFLHKYSKLGNGSLS